MTQQVEPARSVVTDDMVDRFLTWPVPANVYPDGESGKPGRTGTNLLDAITARQMLEYVLSDTKGARPPVDRTVVLSGAQLLDALDFIAPDRFSDPEQLESDALITRGDGHSGTGYYCAFADYPEEGAILLDGAFGTVRPGVNDSRDPHGQGAESIKDEAPRHPDILDNNSVQVGFEAPGKFDFAAQLNRQRDFSLRTFGPGSRVAGVVDHIRKELREVEESNGDIAEWTDVIILSLDGALRSGATPDEIIGALVAKQTKNEGRKWPDWRTADLDKAIEHDRRQDVALVAAQPCVPDDSVFDDWWTDLVDTHVGASKPSSNDRGWAFMGFRLGWNFSRKATPTPPAASAQDRKDAADMFWDADDPEHPAGDSVHDTLVDITDSCGDTDFPITLRLQRAKRLPDIEVKVSGRDEDGALIYEVIDTARAARGGV